MLRYLINYHIFLFDFVSFVNIFEISNFWETLYNSCVCLSSITGFFQV